MCDLLGTTLTIRCETRVPDVQGTVVGKCLGVKTLKLRICVSEFLMVLVYELSIQLSGHTSSSPVS